MIQFTRLATSEMLEVVDILDRVRETSSTIAKQGILKGNKDNEILKTVLELTYNPFKKFGLTEKTLEVEEKYGWCGNDFLQLANKLVDNNINDELRKETSNFLARTDKEIRDLYIGILLKDLKIGVNTTTINKIWKGLIPTSETGIEIKPMLANKFDFEKPVRTDFVVTEKLDGIRCLAICKADSIQLYTRQGKLIEGCVEVEHCLSIIQDAYDAEFILDGELLAEGCDYATVYKETTKRVKNKDVVKTGIKFTVFDMLDIKEFESMKCETPYYRRLETLMYLQSDVISKVSPINMKQVVEIIKPLYIGASKDRLIELLDIYRDKGAEGLMINFVDGMYEFKRSKNIQKVKVMQTADLKIIGFEEGQGRNEGRLGALLVDFKGSTVGVGTGFSDFDREHIWKNQDQYLGKIAEIQYFEISKDKTGVESLRFPVWKHLRTDKTEPSLY